MTLWLTVLGMGIMTFALRFSLIFLLGQLTVPPWLERALRFVPVAVLPAIVVPAIVYSGDRLDLALDNARLPAVLVAALVAWRTRNVLLTIAVGMVTLWLWQGLW